MLHRLSALREPSILKPRLPTSLARSSNCRRHRFGLQSSSALHVRRVLSAAKRAAWCLPGAMVFLLNREAYCQARSIWLAKILQQQEQVGLTRHITVLSNQEIINIGTACCRT